MPVKSPGALPWLIPEGAEQGIIIWVFNVCGGEFRGSHWEGRVSIPGGDTRARGRRNRDVSDVDAVAGACSGSGAAAGGA